MDKQCESKFFSFAESIIKSTSLFIAGEEYEILTVSLHIYSLKYPDPFVEIDDPSRKKGTWFPYDCDYVKYLDIDITKYNETGGIRINCIQSVKSKKCYKSAGEIYHHIEEMLGGKDTLIKLKGKSILSNESPQLCLKRKTTQPIDLIYLPRYARFNYVKEPTEYYLRFLFVTHMLTKNLNFLDDLSYSQTEAIVLYLFLIKKHGELITNEIIQQTTLEKYLRNTLALSGPNSPEAIYKYGDKKSLTKEQICGMFGYYIPRYHKF